MVTKRASWHGVSRELQLAPIWGLVIVGLPFVCFILYASTDLIPKGWWTPLLFCAGFALGAFLIWQPSRLHLKALKRLASSVVGDEKTLVRIVLMQDGAITGKDRGVMYKQFGNLAFKGRRTEFSIPRGGIEGPLVEKLDSTKYAVLNLEQNIRLYITEYKYDKKIAMGDIYALLDSWAEGKEKPGPIQVLPPYAVLKSAVVGIPEILAKLLVFVLAAWALYYEVRHLSLPHSARIVIEVGTLGGAFTTLRHSWLQRIKQQRFLKSKYASPSGGGLPEWA